MLKEHAKLVADRGTPSDEAKHFAAHNYSVVDGVIPLRVLDLIEEFILMKEKKKGKPIPMVIT